MLVRTVERARQDVGTAAGYQATLTVGARLGLWEGLLLEWLPLMRGTAPSVSVRIEIGFEDGSKKVFKAGDARLVEDTTGKGHTTIAIGNEPCVTATIGLKDQG